MTGLDARDVRVIGTRSLDIAERLALLETQAPDASADRLARRRERSDKAFSVAVHDASALPQARVIRREGFEV